MYYLKRKQAFRSWMASCEAYFLESGGHTKYKRDICNKTAIVRVLQRKYHNVRTTQGAYYVLYSILICHIQKSNLLLGNFSGVVYN